MGMGKNAERGLTQAWIGMLLLLGCENMVEGWLEGMMMEVVGERMVWLMEGIWVRGCNVSKWDLIHGWIKMLEVWGWCG